MNDKQLGRIVIDSDFIHEEPDQVATIFAALKLVPVRAEDMWAQKHIAYVALSEQFDPVEKGAMIPEYDLSFDYDDNGQLTEVIAHKRES